MPAPQFEAAKAPKKKQKSDSDVPKASGEVEFADEPPFQDDLPF